MKWWLIPLSIHAAVSLLIGVVVFALDWQAAENHEGGRNAWEFLKSLGTGAYIGLTWPWYLAKFALQAFFEAP